MTDVSFSNAVAAYKAAARAPGDILPEAGNAGADGGDSSFAAMVKQAVRTTVDTNRVGERMSMRALEGKADLRDVMMAVNNAEVTLQTMVSVRDRMVNAYQTILRMPL
ncbi:flagellar hook-basal body complex protein FliE [Roseospira visakhapatnamensis]|uniref:Flagellar hook-basal body complex protein FliE n=1 Tax=Roseospira visakhapatnamensis TaxID=390880 RepID=A0A7W6WAF4_9PROT|nr:flagellar hook-basal body complex protein FliE [Roseospira visakhapatnamensis]MBB4266793.1 flagellar hook-basal body complex protein FliE [Roseospira visakhapatnamensis]